MMTETFLSLELGIREICCSVSKHGSMETAEQMVQYNYEPVQGDQVSWDMYVDINVQCPISVLGDW